MSGKELKDILRANNIGIVKLADLLGYSQPKLSQMLAAKDVKTSLLEAICNVLGVSLDFFYHDTVYAIGAIQVGENVDWKSKYEESKKENLRLEGQCKAYEAAYGLLLEKVTYQNIKMNKMNDSKTDSEL
nr:helix-turn-helix transcriptional regulator [uncultured Lachnoclostridium sp.]